MPHMSMMPHISVVDMKPLLCDILLMCYLSLKTFLTPFKTGSG